MRINGQDRTGVGLVLIRFESGAPMLLENNPHLACRVALLGQPTRVRHLGSARYCAEWDVPGRVESITFGNPWPLDRRAVTALEVDGEAFDAVFNWIGDMRATAAVEVEAAAFKLAALREAALDVARRGEI